jgi:hypothetical protein
MTGRIRNSASVAEYIGDLSTQLARMATLAGLTPLARQLKQAANEADKLTLVSPQKKKEPSGIIRRHA